MKIIFCSLLLISILAVRSAYGQTIHQCWITSIHDSTGNSDNSKYPLLETDAHGNTYISSGCEDALMLAKYNSQGNLLWKVNYDSLNSTFYVNQLAIDQFNQVWLLVNQFVNGFDLQALILKYDSTGNLKLKKTVANTVFHAVGFDQNKNVVFGGFINNLSYNLLKIDSAGNQLWNTGNNDESVNLVSVDEAGNIFTSGIHSYGLWSDVQDVFTKKYTPEGNEIWSQIFGTYTQNEPEYFKQDKKGNTYVAVRSTEYGNEYAMNLLKYDTAGSLKWTKSFSLYNNDYIEWMTLAGMGIDSLNNIYVTISAPQSITFKYHMNGQLEWKKEITDGSYYGIMDSRMEADAGGNVYVTRTIFQDHYVPMDSGFIQTYKLQADSTLEWLMQYDTSSYSNVSTDIDYDAGGNAYVTGFTYDSSTFNFITTKYCYDCLASAAGLSFVTSNLSVDFIDASSNTISWFWEFGDGATDVSQNPSHVYTFPGVYNVCLISSNDCSADTFCNTVTIIATGADFSNDDFRCTVFPNPFSDFTTIRFSLEKSTNLKVDIRDLSGRKIKTIAEGNFEAGNHQLLFDADRLPKGIYLLQLIPSGKTSSGIRTKKIIIQ